MPRVRHRSERQNREEEGSADHAGDDNRQSVRRRFHVLHGTGDLRWHGKQGEQNTGEGDVSSQVRIGVGHPRRSDRHQGDSACRDEYSRQDVSACPTRWRSCVAHPRQKDNGRYDPTPCFSSGCCWSLDRSGGTGCEARPVRRRAGHRHAARERCRGRRGGSLSASRDAVRRPAGGREAICPEGATFHAWKAGHGGMDGPQARRLKAFEEGNAKPERLHADAVPGDAGSKDLPSGKR